MIQETELIRKLKTCADEKYRKFSLRLLPDNPRPLIGVRLPMLRKLAQSLCKENAETFWHLLTSEIYEIQLLRGMTLGLGNFSEEIYLKRCLSYFSSLDSWGLCDAFCTGQKYFKTAPDSGKAFLTKLFSSPEQYTQRVALVLFTRYYKKQENSLQIARILNHIQPQGYYASMGIAWSLCELFTLNPEEIFAFIAEEMQSPQIQKLTLRKILESRCAAPHWKKKIKSLRSSQ